MKIHFEPMRRAVLLLALGLLGGCLGGDRGQVGLRLKFARPPGKGVTSLALGPEIASMDCFFVSVFGSGISATSTVNGESCFQFGASSQLVSGDTVESTGVSISVPAGADRVIRVLGVVTGSKNGCAGKTTVADLLAGDARPSIYRVAGATASVFATSEVRLPVDYVQASALDLVANCLPSKLELLPATPTLQVGHNATFMPTNGGAGPFFFTIDAGGVGDLSAEGFYHRAWETGALLGGIGTTTVRVVDSANNTAIATVTLPPGAVQIGAGTSTNTTSGQLIARDGSGSFVLAGSTDGTIGARNGRGSVDAFVGVLEANGAKRWLGQIGGASFNTFAHDVLFDGAGDVVAAGTTNGNLGLTIPLSLGGSPDVFLAKWNGTNGTLAGGVQLGAGSAATSLAALSALVRLPSTDLVVFGQTSAQLVTVDGAGHGNQDVFLMKTGSAFGGTVVKQLGAGSTNSVSATSITRDPGGNIYVLGQADASLGGVTTPGTLHGPSLFVAKYAPNLTLQWTTQIGTSTTGTTSPVQIFFDSISGGIYAMGLAVGATVPATVFLGDANPPVGTDLFVARFDVTNGSRVWITEIQGGGIPSATTTTAAPSGLVVTGLTPSDNFVSVVATTTGSSVASGPSKFGAAGAQNVLLIRLAVTDGSQKALAQLGAGASSHSPSASIAVDGAGYSFLYGQTDGDMSAIPGTLVGHSSGATELFVAKLNSTGTTAQAVQIGTGTSQGTLDPTPANALYGSLVIDGNSNVTVLGSTPGTNLVAGAIATGTQGAKNVFVARIDTSFTLGARAQIGAAGTTTPQYLFADLIDTRGFSFLFGHTTGQFYGVPYGTHGSQDVFLARVSATGIQQ